MACNCNEQGNTYHLNMGCCVPIVANADAYYTKSEVDEKLQDIIESGCCIDSGDVETMIEDSLTDYAKKSEIPTVPTKVSAFENDVPYLTEHQSLSGYATEQWVENKHYITGVDLSSYATKEYVSGYTYDKETIDEKVAGGGSFDPTQYYTTAQTYSKTEVNNLIPTVPTNVSDFVNDAGYLTSHQPIKTINGNVLVGNGNVQLDIPKIWHGTKAEYDLIETKDADTIYLIYEN